jgi:hypothetical protein
MCPAVCLVAWLARAGVRYGAAAVGGGALVGSANLVNANHPTTRSPNRAPDTFQEDHPIAPGSTRFGSHYMNHVLTTADGEEYLVEEEGHAQHRNEHVTVVVRSADKPRGTGRSHTNGANDKAAPRSSPLGCVCVCVCDLVAFRALSAGWCACAVCVCAGGDGAWLKLGGALHECAWPVGS